MIKIQDLSFSYNLKKKILDNLNLTIPENKFTTIIGPNGSGKTTLIHNLCRFFKPISGNIYFYEKNIKEYKQIELSKIFTFIPQETHIQFPYKVIDVVLMGRIPYKRRFDNYNKNDISIAYDILEKLELLEYTNTYITELSGGEKQRVFFAKALAQNTKLYFLDEAFSAMDISHQISALNILKNKIKEENISVIAILHDLNIIDHYSDMVIVLEKGKLKAHGNKEKIMTPHFLKELFNVNIEKIKNKGLIVIP